MRILKPSIILPSFMNVSRLALITPCDQGPCQGHGALLQWLNELDRGIEEGVA